MTGCKHLQDQCPVDANITLQTQASCPKFTTFGLEISELPNSDNELSYS